MKKLKFAFAGLAVFTAVTTMSFTMTENKAKTADALDCWSDPSLIGQAPDVDQQATCPGQQGECCFKPTSNPNAPLIFGFRTN